MQLDIGSDPAEVGRARRWARSWFARAGVSTDEPLAETLILLISELVTNVVVHTGRPAVVRLRLPVRPAARNRPGRERGETFQNGTVRVEVADSSARPPQRRCAHGDDTGGRGLELVEGLADRWGWQPEGVGKRIWCEVDRLEVAGADTASGRSVPVEPAEECDAVTATMAGAYRPSCAGTLPA